MLKCSEPAIAGEVQKRRRLKPVRRRLGPPGPKLSNRWNSWFSENHPFKLTEREDQVLRLMARGWETKEIARILELSPRTVEIHRGRMLEKMQALSSPHAIALGFVSGVLTGKDLEEGE
jgi:DNA-binding CsgD family transcriptional regulator